jgi:restriction endonuclease S subunit
MRTIVLGDIIREIVEKTTINNQYPVLTSSQSGLVSQGEYFNKQIASQDNTGYKIIRKGQFTYRAMSDTGRFYINQSPYEIGIVSPAYPVFEIIEDGHVLPEYIATYFRSDPFQNAIALQSTGSTRVSLKLGKIKDISIDIPSVSEQKEILENINEVESLIGSRREQLEKLDELVKSRFVELFGDPETNPYGWKQTTVGEVCSSIVRGPFGSALKKEFFVEPNETTYKVYEQKHAIQKSATIGTYYITAEKFDELRRFECVAGDILMSCSGTMGELYQLPEGCEKGLINQALCKFTLNKKILPIVFLTYMKQTIGKLETKGSGIQNIAAVSYVKAMPINLAPMEVQEQFAAFVEQTDKSKLAIQESLAELETLKKALMQKYFG